MSINRFKVIFDDNIFLLLGTIIEYMCFLHFNSIIMTRNKWLVFTKSVIMGLSKISHWPCPLGILCLPCVLHDSILHLSSSCGSLVLWYDSRLAWRRYTCTWFETLTMLCSIGYFYCVHCFVLFALFFPIMASISIFLSHWHSNIFFYSQLSQFMRRCKDCNACKKLVIFVYSFTKRDNSKQNW